MNIFSFETKIWQLVKKFISYKEYNKIIKLYYNLRYLLFIGKKYYWPCCDKFYRKFVSFKNSLNIVCPRNNSLERHRLLYLFLKKKKNFFFDNLKVLHIPPAYSLQRIFKRMATLNYITSDPNSSDFKFKIDIRFIPFPANYFDVIICNHILDYIIENQKAMKLLFRILKAGGWAIFNSSVDYKRDITYETPSKLSKEERKISFKNEDNVRIYGKDYKNRLESVGFLVREKIFLNL